MTVGSYFDNANWLDGVPVTGDTALIGGTDGSAPYRIDGILQLGDTDDLVSLYATGSIPSLIGDPACSTIPVAAPVAGQTIDSNGGGAIVGYDLVNSTLASTTTMVVTGNAEFSGSYTNALNGSIHLDPTTGSPVNDAGYNGELGITVEPIGSTDPNGRTKTGYTPTVTNNGMIIAGAGSHVAIGFNGDPVTFNNVGGIEQALGGHDAFVNTGAIVLNDASLNVAAGYYSTGYSYNLFLNDGLVAILGQASEASARFDAELDGKGNVEIKGAGAATASAILDAGICRSGRTRWSTAHPGATCTSRRSTRCSWMAC